MPLKEIIASLPADKIEEATSHLSRLEQLVKLQSRRDAEIVRAVVRILEHPAHVRLADQLRQLILRGAQ